MSQRSKNVATFIGRIGKKPELEKSKTGRQYTRFSVGCNYSYKKNGAEPITGVDWIPLVAWDKLAEIIVNHLDKGSLISVDAKIKPYKIEKEDGEKRYGVNIVAKEILFLAKGKESASHDESEEPGQGEVIDAQDIPF
jgi:single-strand DNA-binding protein